MTTRVLPPITAAHQKLTVNGRTYSATPGAVVDAPDHDALLLGYNNWLVVAKSGPTAARPVANQDGTSPLAKNTLFVDTTLGKVVVWDGATWRDPVTGASA